MDKIKNSTFIVHVSNTENGTWQGHVVWADTGEKIAFRSAIELMTIMDKAVKADVE